MLHALAAVALVPAFAFWAPPDHGGVVMVLALAALAVVADFHDVALPGGLRLDAGMAIGLIAVVATGPLTAFGIAMLAMACGALARRERLLRAGTLANVAAYGWEALAAGAIVALAPHTGPAALPWLLAAAAAQAAVNLAVGPMLYAPLWFGRSVGEVARSLLATMPAVVVMLTLGALTAALLTPVGLVALAGFAVIAVIPQSALTVAARARPAGRLDALTATRRYASALGLQLGLPRAARRELDAVVRLAHARAVSGHPVEHLAAALADRSEVSCAAGHVTEWWNGTGGPAGIPGAIIPLPSRIAAVARTWAALTANEGPRLSHQLALAHMRELAGVRLDPHVVRAAERVVAQERATTAVAAPEPRLHHYRVPAPLRRAIATGLSLPGRLV